MKRNARKAYNRLAKIGHVIDRSEYGCEFLIGCEARTADDFPIGDYYGEFRGGYPWIDPRAERILSDCDLYAEWINPALIGVYER